MADGGEAFFSWPLVFIRGSNKKSQEIVGNLGKNCHIVNMTFFQPSSPPA
jgi:hypothetical protein